MCMNDPIKIQKTGFGVARPIYYNTIYTYGTLCKSKIKQKISLGLTPGNAQTSLFSNRD